MAEQQPSQSDIGWSKGEIVCLIFMEKMRKWASETKVEWGMKLEQIIAFNKIGCTCKHFRAFLKDPAVVDDKFDYYMEYVLMSRP